MFDDPQHAGFVMPVVEWNRYRHYTCKACMCFRVISVQTQSVVRFRMCLSFGGMVSMCELRFTVLTTRPPLPGLSPGLATQSPAGGRDWGLSPGREAGTGWDWGLSPGREARTGHSAPTRLVGTPVCSPALIAPWGVMHYYSVC